MPLPAVITPLLRSGPPARAVPSARAATTPAAANPGPRTAASGPVCRHRPDVQALRALAVGLVVAFHLWPEAVPGGFLGVDVFLVISGFLITGGLLRELDRTGTIGLRAFWARRVRRLLPAALLVLGAVLAATVAFVPLDRWDRTLDELTASLLYVQNWQLAGSAVDYFAAAEDPTPVQHFWSLAVEEQFYLVWPLVLLGVAVVARHGGRAGRRHAIVAVVVVLTAASLAYALWRVAVEPASAYFATPARAWELGAGALLACRPPTQVWRWVRALVLWLGLAAIVASAFLFDAGSAVPGAAALLPVGGALAVLWAGLPHSVLAPRALLASRPVQALGDLSYGIYLWHWPLLVLLPLAVAVPDGSLAPIVLGGTLVLAFVSKVLVEDPVRFGALARRSVWPTFVAGAAGMALVLGLTGSAGTRLDREVLAAQSLTERLVAQNPDCFGAAARDPRQPCENPDLRTTVVPTPAEAGVTENAPCDIVERGARLRVCAFGATGDEARGTVALVGDSHAAHWRAAVDEAAKAEGWRGVSMTYTGCPLSLAPREGSGTAPERCDAFRREVLAWLARHPEVKTLFVGALAGGKGVAGAKGQEDFAEAARGYAAAWRRLRPDVRVVVLRDLPTAGKGAADCVTRAMAAGRPAGPACARPRDEVLAPDPAVAAARRTGAPRAQVVDLSDRTCDAVRCFPVVGGVLVHRDADHLTPVFSRTLGSGLRRALREMRYTVPA